jgi:hypothetical protein
MGSTSRPRTELLSIGSDTGVMLRAGRAFELISTRGGPQTSAAVHSRDIVTELPDTAPMQYHLAPYVYACRADEGIVFLDARHDRYFGVGGKDVAQLERIIEELRESRCGPAAHVEPVSAEAASSEATPFVAKRSRLVAKLVEQGFLCTGEMGIGATRRKTVPAPEIVPLRTITRQRRVLRASDVMNFVWAFVRAAWSLRRLSVELIAARIGAARGEPERFDFEQVMPLVELFRKLRCWTFSEKDRCLFNALALIYFLQRYGHFPYFVIGVKTVPFAAHAWVQMEGMVLDGNPASVGHFTPILVA